MIDPNIQRRHSMDTSQYTSTSNNTVVKSQSTIMSSPQNTNSSNVSEQLLSPSINRKKSVSSKERLFSVESLTRSPSMKSNENLIKIVTEPINNSPTSPDNPRKPSIKRDENKSTSLYVTSPNDDTTNPQRRLYEHRNSLLPNDPGLNGIGSNQSIDRRSSNESDESDNLSQYFRSPSSRKSSLITTNDLTNNTNHERSQSVARMDSTMTSDASRRLQNFIKSTDEKRLSRGSTGDESIHFHKTEDRKSTSTLGSFKFLKQKTKSVDFSNQVCLIKIKKNQNSDYYIFFRLL